LSIFAQIMPEPDDLDSIRILDWIMQRRVHEFLDAAGRPVGEGRSAAFQSVSTELSTCPYAGSRYHHAKPMNLTALQQMPPWPDILLMLGWLAQRYRRGATRRVETSNDLAGVTSAGVFLADYLTLRRERPLRSGEMPVLVSGLYKVCLGFQLAYLPDRFNEDSRATPLPDAAGFLDYLEDTGLLIGEAEVCAGSPAMVTQAYETIVGGAPVSPEELPRACAGLEIDWDRFDAMAKETAELWRELVMFAVRMPEFLPIVECTDIPAEIRERVNRLLRARGEQVLEAQHGLAVELARMVREFGDTGPEPAGATTTGALASSVAAWLDAHTDEDVRIHTHAITGDLARRIGAYESFETETVGNLNQRMNGIRSALGLDGVTRLEPDALTQILGCTLRNW
jgi:hypothetical protein